MPKITSEKYTLENLVIKNYIFNIPIYQRLYVWKSGQITTLLDDLVNSFNKKEDDYYIGGIMLTKNKSQVDGFEKYDVIDGQQRFTTLWLISHILGGELSHFQRYVDEDKPKSRIIFSVRDFANHYFEDMHRGFTDDEERELKPIKDALKTIKSYFENKECALKKKDFSEFRKFVYQNVYFILTEMPFTVDENKVFEAMNNRGVQLQQHEILKSRILHHICDSERNKYAIIWDACSQMDNYIEKSLKDVANLSWKQLFNTEKDDEIVKLPPDILGILSSQLNDESDSYLRDVLSEENIELSEEEEKALAGKNIEDNDYEGAKVRSIISFSMLLLHTLRIFQYRYKKDECVAETSAEVNAKELNTIFNKYFLNKPENDTHKKALELDAKNFITLLWKVREAFDRYVVKWVTKSEGSSQSERLEILNLYQNKTSYQRKLTKSFDELSLLQTMLYHSQQLITHYWLTPLLNYLIDHDNLLDVLDYLKRLDNAMFCNERRDLRTMSFGMLALNKEELKGDPLFIESELLKDSGVAFPHYYFYKLEFVLWSKRQDVYQAYSLSEKEVAKWESYYLTARNSIEHIFPQNQKSINNEVVYITPEEMEIEKENHGDKFSPIDVFGNLTLITSGLNSSYSNKSYGEKKEQFLNSNSIDSLKSSIIFTHDKWSFILAKEHQKKMINLLKTYLNETNTN